MSNQYSSIGDWLFRFAVGIAIAVALVAVFSGFLSPKDVPYFAYMCEGTSCQFLQMGGGSPTAWDFDDGTTSAESDPFHQYASAGKYEVTLTTPEGSTTAPVLVWDARVCPRRKCKP